jgi:ADP-ribose pyrophosphatase
VAKPPPASADFTESQLATRLAYDGGLLKVRRDEILLPDGGTAWREYVVHPGAVLILAFVDERTVLLERQFRYPKQRHFIELPAGKLEAGEPPQDTARRELIEECGFEAERWWQVATLDPCIGYSTEVIHLFGAAGLRHVGAKLDVGEHLEVFEARLEDALEWIRDGIITDTKTTFGLLYWERFGRFPGK